MSLKECAEKKEIDVKERRTVCDVCGITIEKEAINFRLIAVRNDNHDYGPSSDIILDICSTDCIASNLSGLILLLHSKVMPNVPQLSNRKDEPYGLIKLDMCTEKKASLVSTFRETLSSIKLRG